MRMASRKNAHASMPKPMPKTSPHFPIRPGHSRPNSRLRTVPVTTPMANWIAMTVDHRRASWKATGSFLRSPR